MTESISDILTVQKPAGIPWRLKTAELMPDAQWRTLMALMDAVVPSIQKESTAPRRKSRSTAYISDSRYRDAVSHLKSNTILFDKASEAELNKYLLDRPTEDLLFQQVLKAMLHHVPPELQTLLCRVLYLLTTQAGSLILTGYATPVTKLPLEDRTKILNKWANSNLYKIRGLYRQITTLGKAVFSATNPAFFRLSGYPTTPQAWKPPKGYPFEFIQFPRAPAPAPPPGPKTSSQPSPAVEIETDVVIVGSGCGAGVCAKNLAEAGHRVLVVDKSYYFDASSFPMAAGEAFLHLFEGGCTTGSDDGSISVVAGSCFGGGGTVNWSASLQPQGYVRDEWARDRGLAFFATQEFQNCLDRVCAQMGVHEDFEPNHGNAILLDGARKLGWSAKKVPQNTGRCAHADGYCALGCSTGEKNGPVNGWFPDAARHGAKFAEGFKVKRVLFDESGRKKAVGVVGTWTSRGKDGNVDGPDEEKIVREVIVKAKKVIVSGGTLWSPIILKNSGLRIGRNLYLHPVNVLHGFFKEDVRPWEGGILTTVVNTFEDSDGKGHGPKLEALSMLPCWSLQFLNWTDGVDFKLLALKYRHMNSYISIVRDRYAGSVYPDPVSGQPRIAYTPSPFDRAHAMIGLVALAKILYLQGAVEIHAGLPGMRPFIREEPAVSTTAAASSPRGTDDDIVSTVSDAGIADPRFQAWLVELEKHGNKPPTATFCTAHQMGTNRMSTSEKTGVVDPRGRVWGTEGLYVSDASVFPSASGVNPMVTNMAISDWISRNVAGDLAKDGERARL
ncbi:hypothetical protein DHEL01_v203071 [Diaporthe helianthi]|uniref:Long-chain-alcohol oxidase n=1 Tax=Diaporthe helianthi TaxID=158607 RepID=A0A2P5I7Q3_DIAHE|nr:hypothetical protein DHEL01_v203071 [Diaporthe helianthi]